MRVCAPCVWWKSFQSENWRETMQLMSPIEKSQSTLYSSVSTKSMISSDYHNNCDPDSDTDSDLSYNECDVTFVDDDSCPDAKNEAEMMFFKVVEMLRYEQEVWSEFFFISFSFFPFSSLSFVLCHQRQFPLASKVALSVFRTINRQIGRLPSQRFAASRSISTILQQIATF